MQAVKKTHCKFMFRNRVQTQLTQTLTSWLADTRFSLVFHLRHGLPEVARGAGSQEQTSLPFPFLSCNSISNIFQPRADVRGVGLALVARNLLSSRCKAVVVSSAFSVLVSTAGSAWIPVRPDMSFVIISQLFGKTSRFQGLALLRGLPRGRGRYDLSFESNWRYLAVMILLQVSSGRDLSRDFGSSGLVASLGTRPSEVERLQRYAAQRLQWQLQSKIIL